MLRRRVWACALCVAVPYAPGFSSVSAWIVSIPESSCLGDPSVDAADGPLAWAMAFAMGSPKGSTASLLPPLGRMLERCTTAHRKRLLKPLTISMLLLRSLYNSSGVQWKIMVLT